MKRLNELIIKKCTPWYENISFFRIFYILILLLEMVSILSFFAAILRCFALAWGMFIFVRNYIFKRKIFEVRYYRLIFAYIFCAIITIFLNLNKNFLQNVVLIYHCVICFFIFYGMSATEEFTKIKREIFVLSKCFFIFATFSSVISLIIAIFKFQFTTSFLGEENFFGIFQNRLVGIYTNSNLLAFMMGVALVSADILMLGASKTQKFLLFFGSIINIFSLFLSDSNASFFFVMIYFTARFFCNKILLSKNNVKIQKFKIIISTFFCGLVVIFLAFFFKKICQERMGQIIEFVKPKVTIENINKNSIGRKDYDIDSGRFTLWAQGFEIWKHHPIFGIGRENLIYYGEKYLDGGIIFSDLHNGYLNILVSNGIIGFIFFVIFAFFVARDMFKVLFNFADFFDKNDNFFVENAKIYSIFFSMIFSYGVYSFFERTIFSGITFMVVYFWLMLGYTFSYLKHAKIDGK